MKSKIADIVTSVRKKSYEKEPLSVLWKGKQTNVWRFADWTVAEVQKNPDINPNTVIIQIMR